MTVLWIEPSRCRYCGDWTYDPTFCGDLCEALHIQKRWVEHSLIMQLEEANCG